MKKVLILLGIILICLSCDESKYESVNGEIVVVKKQPAINELDHPKIIVYDSCEYIMYVTAYNYRELTHKGNCKYCEERQKKLLNK